jgi:hypothetical protein
MTSIVRRSTLLIASLSWLSACVVQAPAATVPSASYPTAPSAPSVPAAPLAPMITASHLTPHIGQTGSFSGTYAGWAACDMSTAHTRSDWVVQYVENNGIARCLYVTGGVPQGIAPAPSTLSVGVPVAFKAIVKQGASGKPYLQYLP